MSGLVVLNGLVLWLAGQAQLLLFGVAAIVGGALLVSLFITPLLRKFLTLELSEDTITTLGVLKPMFTMRWDEIDEVRAGEVFAIKAASLLNRQTGKQIGFYLLSDDKPALAAAFRQHTPEGHPLRRYAEQYLK